MTGHAGHLRRRRHRPGRAHGHDGDRPRPHRRARTSTPTLRGAGYEPEPPSRARDLRRAQHLVLRRRAEDDAPAPRRARGASRPSTRSSAASTRRPRSSRRAAACPAAPASPATTATASAPTTPSSSSTRRGPTPTPIDLDYCKGCGLCAQECPCGAIEMRPETVVGGPARPRGDTMATTTEHLGDARPLAGVHVRDAMRPGVLTAPAEASIGAVARIMAVHQVHAVVLRGAAGEAPGDSRRVVSRPRPRARRRRGRCRDHGGRRRPRLGAPRSPRTPRSRRPRCSWPGARPTTSS